MNSPVNFFAPSMSSNTKIVDATWYLDIGASHNLNSNEIVLGNLVSYIGYKDIMLHNGSTMIIVYFGNNILKVGNQSLNLCNALLVP